MKEPKWITEWKSTPNPVDQPEETRRKLRAQSQYRAIMEQFPPLCLVRAKPGVSLAIPGPGDVGFVTSYGDPFGNGGGGDHVTVRLRKPKLVRGHTLEAGVCGVADLEVVGYRQGLTPDFVRETFAPN